MLNLLFEALANRPQTFLDARTGGEFEDRLQAFMRNTMGYNRLVKQEVTNFESLSADTKHKTNPAPIANNSDITQSYIYQPNGSQNYPDFLLFEEGEVVCLEAKFTKNGKPVWNSGLPRPNGFYIIGAATLRAITFFRGCDVVTPHESEQMHEFFAELKRVQDNFNRNEMSQQRKGFAVYIRKAFEQKKLHNETADVDFFTSPDREQFQQNVLDYFAE